MDLFNFFNLFIPIIIIIGALIVLFYMFNKNKHNNYINNDDDDYEDEDDNIELDDKIKSMSAEEYNKYLNEQNFQKFLRAKEKVENIIDQAYQDYINECKIKNIYVDRQFFINENTYGITIEDIDSFIGHEDIDIKNYTVNVIWQHISYLVPDYLVVNVNKKD